MVRWKHSINYYNSHNTANLKPSDSIRNYFYDIPKYKLGYRHSLYTIHNI